MSPTAIKIVGYDLLGEQGQNGLRFAWSYEAGKAMIESAAFPQRGTYYNDDICAYTTSVSAGCMLKSFQAACSFCRTGSLLPFRGPLSYKDIAKQNIFMVLADINCTTRPDLRNRPREFAYMGQGEPGLSYTQLRLAIELTNRAMRMLGQKVYRHIFATCGIPEAIEAYKLDLQHFFTERVTLHYSLHAVQNREMLMPINTRYPYVEILKSMSDICSLSGEKPCIGIMLFNEFRAKGQPLSYSNEFDEIKKILSELDPSKYRLSFCEYNPSDDICYAKPYSQECAERVIQYTRERGFDAKLFSSFGREKQTACGMLGGRKPENPASEKWMMLERQAEELIKLCL